MLYLAEIKKQVKGFFPGNFKTELRLLAWQHNDKTWSAVQQEELVSSNRISQAGEGALLLVKLNQNRQIEETPELAGPELVRQLQKLSRLSEKLKDQRQEIERWKQSLTYQSEELSRRSLEVESRLEEFEQVRQESQFLEQQRQELEAGWNHLREAQRSQRQAQYSLSPENFPDLTQEQVQSLQELIGRLVRAGGGSDLLTVPLERLWEILQSQQTLFDHCCKELERQQAMVEHWQQELQHQEEMLALNRQKFQAFRASLEQIKIRFQGEQITLLAKQELYKRLDQHLQKFAELELIAEGLGIERTGESLALNIDIEAIENMPLGELKAIASQLESDLTKLVNFVNDQEEELSFQTETVRELEGQLAAAREEDQFSLEAALTEEQEKKQMLDRTLFGQRRNLRERQQILQEHLRILHRREGAIAVEATRDSNIDPLLRQLQDYRAKMAVELQQLQGEIEYLQGSLQQFDEVIEQEGAEQNQQAEVLQIDENKWQQARANLLQTQARLELYTQSLQPLQQQWQEIQQIWQSVRAFL